MLLPGWRKPWYQKVGGFGGRFRSCRAYEVLRTKDRDYARGKWMLSRLEESRCDGGREKSIGARAFR